jgi:RNA polymerase sigma factor (sigma-70 family)
MSTNREALMGYIRRLATLPASADLGDAALLSRYIASDDEQAFTALVKRHATMVYQVCWRILGNGTQAEDAFQATFLILARKARTIRPRSALPGWLHGVARRVAHRARTTQIRREGKPLVEAPADAQADPLSEISAREMLTIIDEEIQRLPEQYRQPVILCGLGGRSLEDAARQLGWTTGSVKGRLERGRARLHDRLVRRGLTLSTAPVVLELSRTATSAAVVSGLIARTVPAALTYGLRQGLAAGMPRSAAALAAQVGLRMALPRLGVIGALLLVTTVLGAGVAFRLLSTDSETTLLNPAPRNLTATESPLKKNPIVFWDQSDDPVDVRGQVIDPLGKPVAGAELYVGYTERRFVRGHLPERFPDEMPRQKAATRRATTDADGRFQFRLVTSELDPRELDDARPAILALAAGYGPDWIELGPTTAGNLRLQLVNDLPASGRVLDAQNKPIAGARLSLERLYSGSADELTLSIYPEAKTWTPRCWKGPLPGMASVIYTDAEGRWRCPGLGRDRIAAFALDGPKLPRMFLNVATQSSEIKQIFSKYSPLVGPAADYVAPAMHRIRGAVLDAATRKPIADVQISLTPGTDMTRSGPDGQFDIYGLAEQSGFAVQTLPENGSGYFAKQGHVRGKADATESTVELLLVRGIALSGKVINRDTGKPPKSARVEYFPLSTNQNCRGVVCYDLVPSSTATVRPDGSYSLVVLPGPGFLGVIASPQENYAMADLMNKELVEFKRQQRSVVERFEAISQDSTSQLPCVPVASAFSQPRALRISKYHALALINPPVTALSEEQDFQVRSTQIVQGTVVGPDGQPLSDVEVFGLTAHQDPRRAILSEALTGTTFTVTGLNSNSSRKLYLYHTQRKLGKAVTVYSDMTQTLIVQLEPHGTIKGRLLDENGKPMPHVYVSFSEDESSGSPTAQTDVMGRFQLDLFPGLKHSWGMGQQLVNDLGRFEVRSGEVRELGDLTLKPRPVRQIVPKSQARANR